MHSFDPSRAYTDLPKAPPDGYCWERFFKDQKSRPLIFHGTSSVFMKNIRERGLTFDATPYDPRRVAEVVNIFRQYRLYDDPNQALATLHAFTAVSAEMNSISFTFDYQRACSYAIMYRCGETINHLWHLLNRGLNPPKASFTASESALLADYQTEIAIMVAAHRPMVVSVEFAAEDFVDPDLAFFSDRNVFFKLLNDYQGPVRFLGYYSPRLIWRGREYRATKPILPEQIRGFFFPKGQLDPQKLVVHNAADEAVAGN
jgi:hypothetical protein